MSKALWKTKSFTFTNIILLNFDVNLLLDRLQIFNKSTFNSRGSLQIVNRFVGISLYFKLKNMNISIYNGKFFFIIKLNINNLKDNFKFGELSYTRRLGLIHKSKKKLRLKKK